MASQRRSLADLAEDAIDIVSKHLGYFKVPCPYKEYGCGSTVASRDAAAHTAACAHAPCACQECAFLGSPAQLVRHLTAGPHNLSSTEFTYGEVVPLAVNVPKEHQQYKHLFVAEEDNGVFLLAVGRLVFHSRVGSLRVVCLRGNAGAGPVYRSSVLVVQRPGCSTTLETGVRSCSALGSEFDMDPFWLHPQETKLNLRIRIDRMT